MANESHVQILEQGVDAWNQWRAQIPGIEPDLRGANFKNLRATAQLPLTLASCQLSGATFSGLLNVSFAKTPLAGVRFVGTLCQVEFGRCTLTDVDFADAVLQGCRLTGVRARDCTFASVQFQTSADGADCSLENGAFSACSFKDARLGNTSLRNAVLRECDLRDTHGLKFDNTAARGNLLSSGASDDWSVLRRKYTGANMIFNLLFMAMFFGPWALETVRWVSLNMAQTQLIHVGRVVEAELQKLPESPQRETSMAVLRGLKNPEFEACMKWREGANPTGSPSCMRTWQVLLGIHEGWRGWLLASVLLMYNLARLVLTWVVAPLRDEEDRSGLTPRRAREGPWWQRARPAAGHYGWLMPLHRFVGVTFWLAIAAALFHFVPRLHAPVWLA